MKALKAFETLRTTCPVTQKNSIFSPKWKSIQQFLKSVTRGHKCDEANTCMSTAIRCMCQNSERCADNVRRYLSTVSTFCSVCHYINS
jgi:hypothetical protein